MEFFILAYDFLSVNSIRQKIKCTQKVSPNFHNGREMLVCIPQIISPKLSQNNVDKLCKKIMQLLKRNLRMHTQIWVDYQVMENFRLEGTSVGHLVQSRA